jgi:hypothetical protein
LRCYITCTNIFRVKNINISISNGNFVNNDINNNQNEIKDHFINVIYENYIDIEVSLDHVSIDKHVNKSYNNNNNNNNNNKDCNEYEYCTVIPLDDLSGYVCFNLINDL